MKALSIRQPFAWLVATGKREYDIRTWSTDYRGKLLIHAAKANDAAAWADAQEIEEFDVSECPKIFGAIIGEAELVDVVWEDDLKFYIWLFENAKLFKKPVPYKGKLHLFEVDIKELAQDLNNQKIENFLNSILR